MKALFRLSLVVALLAVPVVAFAQGTPTIGILHDGDCATDYDIIPNGGELYAIKINPVAVS